VELTTWSSDTSEQGVHLLSQLNARSVIGRRLDLSRAVIKGDDRVAKAGRSNEAEEDLARPTGCECRLVAATYEKCSERKVICDEGRI
jgi:hypothetical protein